MVKIVYTKATLLSLNRNCGSLPQNADVPRELRLSKNPHATAMFRNNSGCKPLNFKDPFHKHDHDQDHPDAGVALTVK